jgi:glucosamine kinase
VPYYLGIDGGGTKTTCAVGDETRLLATVTAGPSNVVRVGEAQARDSLHQGVRQACAAAGIEPGQIARTCVGGSGAGRPELAALVRSMLAEILASPVEVVGDLETSLYAAFDGRPGVIVIGGTGSSAYGKNSKGMTARAGGWGFAIGDEGSAHWIGRAAVNAILRAADEGPEIQAELVDSSYVKAIFKAWGVNSILDLAGAANSIPPPDFSVLFPAVATNEYPLSIEVLEKAGRELARIALVVIRRLFHAEQNQSVPVGMIGGVFRHSARVRQVFYNELRAADPRVELKEQVVDPVEGALRMARNGAS